MAQNSRMIKPETQGLVHLTVLRTAQISPHFMRVTLGGAEVERFRPMGWDQWFRIFLPLGGDAGLERIPAKANKIFGYLKYLRIPEGMRPVMRNYSVRAYRAASGDQGAEIDVDFVIHGTVEGGDAGPASRWAQTCRAGESVVIIDEGLMFNPERGTDQVLLVTDESGLPAVANVCASLPGNARGIALVEVPSADDILEFTHPVGIDVRWLVRDHEAKAGALALDALVSLRADELPAQPFHAFIVGEQSLPAEARRHLANERGIDKNRISFSGYWRTGAASPTPKSQIANSEARA
ncbi:siderophore-interacting protein [Microbacterium terricola]|uniref:Siderophore-interacting protein n=1 Tax=Microbacterium terricola TaxID=344163 RepID=A0ABM8DV60_9MICO|nr:siderophore-interacting protein [Microbacterium terricola]UYK39765.1 siderophore-interacting protein [Microbacterium terricola]BDV29485.1 siderophore-interacting protein [Microbacterium terricola]